MIASLKLDKLKMFSNSLKCFATYIKWQFSLELFCIKPLKVQQNHLETEKR